MSKNRNYGYYEAMDLDWLNKHPDAPVMFKPVKRRWFFESGLDVAVLVEIVIIIIAWHLLKGG